MSIFDEIKKSGSLLKKAFDSGIGSYIDNIEKSISKKDYYIDPKSLTGLENHEDQELGYKNRASAVSFDVLRQMAMRNTIVAAIIQCRKNQIKPFGIVQPSRFEVGFKFKMRDYDKEPEQSDKESMAKMEKWILTCGGVDFRPAFAQWSFVDFLGIMVRDLLIFDQVAIETVPAKDGTIAYFMPSSSGSIMFASKNLKKNSESLNGLVGNNFKTNQFSDNEEQKREQEIARRDASNPDDYRYVQIKQGHIVRGFTDDELILKMMNPVTDLEANGYSVGPLELLANTVSYHLYAEAHNRLFFVQGFASRGILHIEGDIPKKDIEAFRRQWREQISGSSNSWRTPILSGGTKINWIALSPSNRDMEWNGWVEYLIKNICAIYSIAPQEINFDITRAQGPTFADSGAKNDSILMDSKIRGLWPILKFFEGIINDNIIKKHDPEFYEKYEFSFCGFHSSNIETELDRIKKESEIYKTINEIRAEHDLEAIEGGDIICNSTYIQWRINEINNAQMAKDQASQQESQDLVDNESNQLNTDIDSVSQNSSDTGDEDYKNIDEVTKSLANKFSTPELLKVEYYKK